MRAVCAETVAAEIGAANGPIVEETAGFFGVELNTKVVSRIRVSYC
jgi:hypothetical protein